MASNYRNPLLDMVDLFWWKNGIPSDFWVANRQIIKEFIDQHQLHPVPAEHLIHSTDVPINVAIEEGIRERLRPRPFPGGMRIPHLHYAGEFYELTPEQWAEFSQKAVGGFRAKLEKANAVTFDKMLELSDAIDSLH